MSCGYGVIRVMRPFCLRLCDLLSFVLYPVLIIITESLTSVKMKRRDVLLIVSLIVRCGSSSALTPRLHVPVMVFS